MDFTPLCSSTCVHSITLAQQLLGSMATVKNMFESINAPLTKSVKKIRKCTHGRKGTLHLLRMYGNETKLISLSLYDNYMKMETKPQEELILNFAHGSINKRSQKLKFMTRPKYSVHVFFFFPTISYSLP